MQVLMYASDLGREERDSLRACGRHIVSISVLYSHVHIYVLQHIGFILCIGLPPSRDTHLSRHDLLRFALIDILLHT